MSGESDQTKEFEPSQRKLEESRRRGDLPRSADLSSGFAMAGMLAALIILGPSIVEDIGHILSLILQNSARLWPADPVGAIPDLSWGARIAASVAPIFLIPAAFVLCLLIASKSLVFAPDRIRPKLERISLLKNASQKFGIGGWVEFFKSLLKLLAASALVTLFLAASITTLAGTAQLEVGPGLSITVSQFLSFLAFSAGIALLIGSADFLWQRYRHQSRLRMTRQEMKQETRESEGDSHLKHRRRQKGYDIATNRMLLDVPKAQVVLVNPSHYAVALIWDGKAGTAPVCIAKGVDEVAGRIRDIARQAGVPIHRDPATARAIYATVEIGAEVRPDQYRSVAAAIRFAEKIRRKADRSK